MKQVNFGEIVGELLRFVLMLGFFLAMIKYSVEYCKRSTNPTFQALI